MTSIFVGPSRFPHKDAVRVVIIYGTVTESANSLEVHDLSFKWSFVLSHHFNNFDVYVLHGFAAVVYVVKLCYVSLCELLTWYKL